MFGNPELNPESEATRFIDAEKGFTDVKAVLEGAKYILMERFAEDADLLAKLRDFLKHNATLSARVVPGKGNRRRQVQRLLRTRRGAEEHPLAPGIGDLPRTQRGHPQRQPQGRR